MTEKKPAPPPVPGCICVLAGPNGLSFIGTAFNKDRPGGFSLRDAQKHYARQSMIFEFWRRSTSHWLQDVRASEYDIERFVSALTGRTERDWRIEYHYVGHEDEQ